MSRGAALPTFRRFIDGFVPQRLLEGDPEEARRARLALGVAWLMVLAFVALAVTRAAALNFREAALNTVLSAVIAGAAFALRATGRVTLVLNVVLTVVYGVIVTVSVVARGPGITSATVALAEIPLFATVLGGIRTGAVWAVLCTLGGIGIGVLGRMGLIVDRVPPTEMLFNEHSALVIITFTLFLVGAMYEFRKDESARHIAALEGERRASDRERIRAQTDADLARTERLASMGRLAASAAHEINNPLSYVASNLEFIRRGLGSPDARTELVPALADAEDGVRRIARIVSDLRTLTRPEDEQVGPVDACRAVRTALKMAENHTRHRARVTTRFDSSLPVLADESRLVQVFLNLVINAAQAIPEGHAREHEIAVSVQAVGAEQVVVEIRDTGTGIPEEILHKVTEPFFSTKPIGEGTGLGLSLCDGILRRYGGRLELASSPAGTTARVVLEAAPDALVAPVSSGAPLEPDPSVAPIPTGMRLLVVDDEPLVARGFARLLRGHRVTVVGSGREALRLLEGGERYDVVFCDVMMPDLSGMAVYEALGQSRPELLPRIVFMSGGTFTERARAFRATVPNVFLEKPFAPDKVARLLAERVPVGDAPSAARAP